MKIFEFIIFEYLSEVKNMLVVRNLFISFLRPPLRVVAASWELVSGVNARNDPVPRNVDTENCLSRPYPPPRQPLAGMPTTAEPPLHRRGHPAPSFLLLLPKGFDRWDLVRGDGMTVGHIAAWKGCLPADVPDDVLRMQDDKGVSVAHVACGMVALGGTTKEEEKSRTPVPIALVERAKMVVEELALEGKTAKPARKALPGAETRRETPLGRFSGWNMRGRRS
jgi:hypothetical protein